MPMTMKVNGKEVTLAQIAALIVILTALGGGALGIHKYFAKTNDMLVTDLGIQQQLYDLQIDVKQSRMASAKKAGQTELVKEFQKQIRKWEANRLAVCERRKDLMSADKVAVISCAPSFFPPDPPNPPIE